MCGVSVDAIVIMVLLAVFGGYVFTSILLFKFPNLIHKRREIKFKCRHISHRGGAGENYENTMVAFRRAIALGTDMLEIDCHLTRDGKVVVAHDHNLLRSTGKNCDISQIDYSDLPLLKPELPMDFDPDNTFIGSGNPEERRLVLLEEVFSQFPKIPINIDIKMDDDNLIKKVSELISKYNRKDITVWGNFSDKITQKCYAENPQINLFFSMKRVVHLLVLMYTGLLPFWYIKETHLELFLPSIYLRRKNAPSAGFLPLKTMLVRSMDFLLMKKSLFEHLDKRGIQTYLWVLNHDDEFKKAFELGAAGVMTDYPTRLKTFLEENPQYK